MRRPIHAALVLTSATILFAGAFLPRQLTAISASHPDFENNPFDATREFLAPRLSGEAVTLDSYRNGMWQAQKLSSSAVLDSQTAALVGPPASTPSLNGVVWKSIGPSPFKAGSSYYNGRVNSIAIHPYNGNVVYMGTPTGGVWQSKNGGTTWTSLTDHEPMLAIGEPSAITIDPNNTNVVYVGNSTAVNNTTGAEGSALDVTQGIMKSTDGGGSWIVLGSGYPPGNTGNANLFVGRNIYSIIVDPANSNRLYLASNIGLYRSTDGGLNWTIGTNGGGVAESLALDPSSPTGARVLFAGINSTGVKRSTDGGLTWTTVLTTATTALANALTPHNTVTSNAGIGKVAVALAPPASPPNAAGVQVVYLTIEGNGGNFIPTPYTPILGIFQSTDQGTNWALRSANAPPALQCQCFYTNTIAVDPASPGNGTTDTVYWGGTNTFRSDDGGATFSDVTNGIHADSHAWAFTPQGAGNPSIVFAGNDGGIFKSTDKGATWTGTGAGPATINGGGLQSTQIYHMDVKSNATADVTLNANQDNGTVKGTGSLLWNLTNGGDGLDVVFAKATTDDAFAINNGGPTHSGNSGDTWSGISGDLPGDQIQIFRNTMNVDPNTTSTLYFSGAATPAKVTPPTPAIAGQLWQSTNGGTNWRNITQFTAISTVGPSTVAAVNSNNVAVAVGGKVFVSTNALASTVGPPSGVVFTDITRDLPGRSVTRIAFDPIDPTVIYATLSGFGGGHVFATTIGGSGWTDISPAVDVPFNGIALDGATNPTTIYVGTDLGVYRSVDGGSSWTTLDQPHFPNCPVSDLQINPTAHVLRASTYGRGTFEFAPASGQVISVNADNGLDFGSTCVGTASFLTIHVYNVGTDDLVISSVQRLFGSTDFTVVSKPTTPLTISPDAHVDFTVKFQTSTPGSKTATIRINSDDPGSPTLDLTATADVGNSTIATAIADSGSFGDVCIGDFKDLDLTINNSGTCTLNVTGISSSSGQFSTPSVASFPLTIAPNTSLHLPIRLQPTTLGAKSSTITIYSNDPSSPATSVNVSGTAPPGDVRVTGSTDFGSVCAGVLAEKPVSVCNVGECNLHVTSVALNPGCVDFTLINNPFPAPVSPDSCQNVVVRFTPTSAGPKTCTLTITTDDPDTPVIVKTLTGNTPAPVIDVPPDLGFPAEVIQSVGPCSTPEPFPVSNNGQCNLSITGFAISSNTAEYGLAGLPSFPIILQPGHIAGEGNLQTVFHPVNLSRADTGNLTITYVSDPITGALTSVTRALCGEGVRTGARVLVTAGGVPLATVEQIKIQRINANRNKPLLDTVDTSKNLALQTVVPPSPCAPFQYHKEYGTVSNPIQLLPGSYQVTVTAIVAGHRVSRTVGFDVGTCDFNGTITVNF